MARHRVQCAYTIADNDVKFEDQVLIHHKQLKSHWLKYLLDARPVILLTAPVIYLTIVPFVLLDLGVSVYQFICFRVYRIPSVRRRDYLLFDRRQLGYLNWFEQFNCSFCSYGNGVIGYAREIAARTEQYWCPIKHSRRIVGEHERYATFADYGDATAYHSDLVELREKLAE